ncbi:MAG: U32 family peptidase C-terminal domain-containing protein, partial [Eubacteriales bacterium]
FLGIVQRIDENGFAVTEQKNKFSVGETIEIMKPDGRNIEAEVLRILDGEGCAMESAPHPKQELHIEMTACPEPWDILRKKNEG